MSDPAITQAQVLSTLLTVESLLFAALAVTVSLSAPTNPPRKHAIKPSTIALAATPVLLMIALGAATAWWNVFIKPDNGCSFALAIQALAVGLGIVAQPVAAPFIARSTRG